MFQGRLCLKFTIYISYQYKLCTFLGKHSCTGVELTGGCRDEVFFMFAFIIGLPHRPVTPFLSIASTPKKNPGSIPSVALFVTKLAGEF